MIKASDLNKANKNKNKTINYSNNRYSFSHKIGDHWNGTEFSSIGLEKFQNFHRSPSTHIMCDIRVFLAKNSTQRWNRM